MRFVSHFNAYAMGKFLLQTVLAFCVCFNCLAAVCKTNTLKVLIIGNSFSDNATTYLQTIANERGKKVLVGKAELSSCTLEKHWQLATQYDLNKDSEEFKPYNRKSLSMLLREQKWDVITLQQYSYLSGFKNSYQPYLKYLIDYLKKEAPSAKIVLHETWAYRSDAIEFGKIEKNKNAASQLEMFQHIHEAYSYWAKEFSLKIIPVGSAFFKMSNNSVCKYSKDTSFDFRNPVYPNIPVQQYSLNEGYYWNGNKEFDADFNHANIAGKYLGSLVWYKFLFHASPQKIKFKPIEIDKKFADRLKEVAEEVVTQGI